MSAINLSEAAVRFAAFGILILIAILLLRDGPRRWTGYVGAAFAATAASYLLCSFGPAREGAGIALPLLQAACLAAPYFLWLTALAVFGDIEKPRWPHALPLAILEVGGFISIPPHDESGYWVLPASLVHQAAVLGLYGHALLIAGRNFTDDLIEGRRKFRGVFIATVALFGVVVALTEVLHGGGAISATLEFASAVAILVLAAAFALFTLRLDPNRLYLTLDAPTGTRGAAPISALSPADRHALDLILKAVEVDRIYRRDGLTISALARTIKLPEHLVRRAINAGLGYRNFSAFLNRYRIQDIKLALADRAKARVPILTIALESGYSSLAPFNRAFREATGMTPSAYRKAAIGNALDPEPPTV